MRSTVVRSIAAAVVIVSTVVLAAPAAAAPSPSSPSPPSPPTVEYAPPVDAPVSDPFRPPTTRYGPGNRGLEFATGPGTPVAAAADGTVVFAGPVAGRSWITISHADGVRTTCGPLAEVRVAVGALVSRGEVVGTTSGPLTFTARVGDAYVDPMSLFGTGPIRVHLVPEPLDIPGASGGGWRIPGVDAVLAAMDYEIRHLSTLPGDVLALTPAPVISNGIDALLEWHDRQGHCTSPSQPPPALHQRHLAVLVAGLGSSSDSAAVADVDTGALGYDPHDVVRFSYTGGRVPASGPAAPELASLPQHAYGAADTVGDLATAAHRVADVLRAIARAPATADAPVIDVIAHSQGGLVVRAALAELEADEPDVLDRLGTVVTLGTPHHGADLAGAALAADAQPLGHLTVGLVADAVDVGVAPDDLAVGQLAPGSPFLRSLAAHPPPPGVRIVSIAARGDLVVPATRARLDGAVNVIVPGDGPSAHDGLPRSAAATREMALAVTGADPTCETAVDALLDSTSGTVISNFEHTLGVLQGGGGP